MKGETSVHPTGGRYREFRRAFACRLADFSEPNRPAKVFVNHRPTDFVRDCALGTTPVKLEATVGRTVVFVEAKVEGCMVGTDWDLGKVGFVFEEEGMSVEATGDSGMERKKSL